MGWLGPVWDAEGAQALGCGAAAIPSPAKSPALQAARMLCGCETKCVNSGLIGKTFEHPALFWGYLRSWRTGLSRCLPFLPFSLMAYSSFPLPDSFVTGQQKNTGFAIPVVFFLTSQGSAVCDSEMWHCSEHKRAWGQKSGTPVFSY